MAANKETLKLPTEVYEEANWGDDNDIDVDYATQANIKKAKRGKLTFLAYNDEEDYISPQKVSRETAKRAKSFNQRIGAKAFFFATADKLAA